MSVIIRLQNLSWSANSVDIRQFFHGLAIPEGGVHIVGGPKGDAFIAFATDEDARQGMERSGGTIKDTKIKLLLSSRSEMQKVIEQARSAVAAQPPVVAPVPPPPPPAAVVVPPAASVADQRSHRHRSRSRERRERSSPDRRRNRRSSPDRRRSRERSRDRASRRSDDRRRHDDGKKDRDRDNSSRRKSTERPAPEVPKVPDIPVTVAELPTPDPAVPWKSSFQSIEKTKSAGPMWDSIKGNFDASPPMDAAGLIPRVPQAPILGAVYDAVPAPSDRPPIYPEEAKMGPSDFRTPPASQMPPVAMPDSRRPTQMHPAENPMADPVNPAGFGAPRDSTFEFSNNKIAADRSYPPNYNMPMEGSYPPSDMPPYDIGRPSGGIPPTHYGNNGLMPPEANNGMDGQFEPGRPPNDYFPPTNRRGYGGDSYPGNGGGPYNEPRMDGGGYPPSNNKSRPYPKHFPIEIKEMSYGASYKDIREHFRGLHIPTDGLKICRDGSRKTGFAYAKFLNERDQMEALSRTAPSKLGQYIEIRPCSEQEFEAARDPNYSPRAFFDGGNFRGNNNNYNIRNEEFVVLLKGLPYQCQESDVVNFFKGIKIKSMHIEYDRFGKAIGTGMVSFFNSESCTRALGQSRQRIGHRYIEVILANGPDSRGPPPRQEMGGGPPNGPLIQGPPPGRFDGPYCVALRHIPPNAIDRDIAHFFGVTGATPQNIHIMFGYDGRPCGDAFAEFATQLDFDKALSRSGQYLLNSCIMVGPISYQEMREVLSRPNRNHNPEPLLGNPHDRPPADFDHSGPWPPQPNIPEEHPPFNGRGTGPILPPPEIRGPPIAQMGQNPEGFGKPGCVLGISGISPNAGVADILEFLKEFEIKKEAVIRKFDHAQQPTGDARVALSNPQDTQRAASLLNNRPLAGQVVHVFIP